MKKLLIVVGAGASMEFGMPTVSQIDSLFEQWGLELAPLANEPGKSLYSWVKERVKAYACQKTGEDYFGLVNFEQLLYGLQAIASLDMDKNAGYYRHSLNPFIDLTALPEIVDLYWKKTKIATGHDFGNFAVSLLDQLVKHFREICSDLATQQQDNVKVLRSFLLQLQKQFDIGIINLNYDNVMLTAMPELKTGFNSTTNAFDRSLLYDGNWNFCYHMHGSVYFDMRGGKDTEMHKIFWNSDLRSLFAQNGGGRNRQFTREGHAHATTSIIAGLDKPNQLLLAEPFGAYFMQLDQLIYEADAILFLGYGFNDSHINQKFPFIRYDEKKYRKVVVVDYAPDRQSGLGVRSDSWAGNVFRTLPFDKRDFTTSFSEPKIAAEFKQAHALDRSVISERPLAVWYEGMMAACRYPDKILKELC